MNTTEKQAAILLRRVFKYVLGYKDAFETTSDNAQFFYQEASDLIKQGLESDAPFAVSRFGYSELRAILTYLHIKDHSHRWRKVLSFAQGKNVEPWWHENTVKIITQNAGVFPVSIDIIERFVEETLREIEEIDVLGSWLGGEVRIKHLMPTTKFMRFHDFYHFLHKSPWTSSLENKKVLVVHPFEESIKKQYNKKELLFAEPYTLPDFDLKTIRAVQSIAGNNPKGFNSWFEALDSMKSKISATEFDVAILGCGAYGMPLATYIKRLGKKAIHLGGNTQILFGIKGQRWEKDPQFSKVFNKHWVRPNITETPVGHETIDGNCYW